MPFYEVRVFKKSTGKHEIKKAASCKDTAFLINSLSGFCNNRNAYRATAATTLGMTPLPQ